MVDSLRIRYFYKLGAKILNVPINVAIAAIVPRLLGAANYGNFNFVTDFFSKLMSFLDTGTSSYFYTHLSRQKQYEALLRFYWGLVIIISTISIAITAIVFILGKEGTIWVDQKGQIIWLGFIWGLLYWYHQIIYKIVDAMGATVKAEIASVKQKVIGLVALSALTLLGDLSLEVFFLYHYILYTIIFFMWWKILSRAGIKMFPRTRISKSEVKNYSRNFFHFSYPMFWGGVFTLAFGFGERWLLQVYGGSVEQGMYSLSFQVSALCFLFTSSMTPLFHREISRAYGENDHEEAKRLFLKFVPMLYAVSATIGLFFCFQAEKITYIIGGSEYSQAIFPVALMSLFPIHQTYGQLNSAVYFATNNTRIYRNIGIFTKVIGFIVTLYFIAPKEQFGLDLGSTGLALKMVLVQLLGQNILLWYNSKIINISFLKMVNHQIITLCIIGSLAGLISILTDLVIGNIIVSILVAGFLYILSIIAVVFIYPRLFSITNYELNHYFDIVKGYLSIFNK